MRKRLLMIIFGVFCMGVTMGARFDCDEDNPDCEFFCWDDDDN